MSTWDAWKRPLGLVAVWVATATVAVTIGVISVSRVGASLDDRGPLGDPADLSGLREGSATPDPDDARVERRFSEEFGEIVVACQGPFAIGVAARPDEAAGWRTVSFETGPDDDVDGVFATGDRSIEIEVFCNRGTPTVGEVEQNTLPDQEAARSALE